MPAHATCGRSLEAVGGWHSSSASSGSRAAQAVAGIGIEEVDGLAVGGETRAGVAGGGSDGEGNRRGADRAVDEARCTELFDEVPGERHLTLAARTEAQI